MIPKIQLIVTDENSITKENINKLPEYEDSFKIAAFVSDTSKIIKFSKELNPCVILMDINFIIKNGLSSIEKIKEENPHCKIIVLASSDDNNYILQTLNLGADGYILRNAGIQLIIDAIKSVSIGDTYIQPTVLMELIKELNISQNSNKPPEENFYLTSREIEVLSLIAKGMLNKEIANFLYISEKTVKNHISSIFRKLNVEDRTQAAVFALKNKIVSG